MASRREFKKELNQVLSEVIEECYVKQLSSDDKTYAEAEKIIDEAIQTFDSIMARVYDKDVESSKVHFRNLKKELEERSGELYSKIEDLK